MDVAVVGGGVIGCAVARELALRGMTVVLLDRGEPGNASWAAAGMLSPQAEAKQADPFLDLLLASRRMYPGFVAALHAETGMDVGYRSEGTILVALRAEDEPELRDRLEWQLRAGLSVDRLDAARALALEPSLSPGVRSALYFPEDHQVDNRLLGQALLVAAGAAGAVVRSGVEVAEVRTRQGRVAGVALAGGEVVDAEWVVVAGGVGSGRLHGLPRPLPVRPVHGQLVAIRPRRPTIAHVVDSPRVYLVPRGDGRIIVGATMEEIGLQRRVTEEGMRDLLTAAGEVVPGLSDAPVVERWSGHRPGSPDGWPILGLDPEVAGLVYATGHYRNGILLTPITGKLIADTIVGAPAHQLDPFSLARLAH